MQIIKIRQIKLLENVKKNKPMEKLWRKNAGMNRNAMGSECFVAWSDYEKANFSL